MSYFYNICEAAINAKLINAFILAVRIVQLLFFLNPKFQASSLLMWLHRAVCVGPSEIPKTVFLVLQLIYSAPT